RRRSARPPPASASTRRRCWAGSGSGRGRSRGCGVTGWCSSCIVPAWVARCVPRLQGVIAAGSTPDTALDPVSPRRGSGRTARPSYEALADYCGRALGPEPRGLVAEQCPAPPAGGPRLLTRVREAIRTRHLSPRTEEAYVFWIRRYVLFHGKRHPLLRDSSARGRLRYPYGSRTPRSPRR